MFQIVSGKARYGTMSLKPGITELLNRARADLRMGLPVVLGAGGGTGALAVAAEALDAVRLGDLRALGGGPVLAITARRAETLKARPYDGDLARLEIPPGSGLEWIGAVADPADDLRQPLITGHTASLLDNPFFF